MLSLGNKLTLTTQPIYKFVNKYSIDFDGVDDRIITDGADTVAQPTTYSFWCKSSTTGQNNGVFGHGSDRIGAFHFNRNADRPQLFLGTNYLVIWNDTSAQDDGEWHHWVVYADTNDITNSKLYVDGVLQSQSFVNSSGSLNAYTESLTIGSERQSGGNSFEGQIDEFAVYDRELTQAEITRMYNTYYSPNRVANGNFSQIGNEEVKNKDFSQIGSEEVTGFTNGTTYPFTTFTTSGNNITSAIVSSAFAGAVSNAISVTSGKIYKVTFDYTKNSGDDLRVVFSSVVSGAGTQISNSELISASGSYTKYFTITSTTTGYLQMGTGNSGHSLNASITNISVKEVGQDWGVYTSGTSTVTFEEGAVLNIDGSNSNVGVYQENVFTNGTNYKIVVNMKATASFDAEILESQGASTVNTIGNVSLTTSYQEFTFYYQGTGTNDLFIHRLSSASGANQKIYIKSTSIKEVGQHWTFGTGWSMGDEVATCDGTDGARFNQFLGLQSSKTYKFSIKVSNYTSGSIGFQYYNGSYVSFGSMADGVSTTEFTTTGTPNGYLYIRSTNFIGSVDNIVLQELKHDATNLMLNAGAYQSANPLITSTKSMEFDGVDDYLEVQDDSSLQLEGSAASWTFWTRLDSLSGGDQKFIAKATTVGGANAAYQIRTNNADLLFQSNDGGWYGVTASSFFTDLNWVNVTITLDSSNLASFYKNGVLFSSGNLGIDIPANTGEMLFGARTPSSPTNFLNGEMTEVGIYNRCLTALEVASLYNQGVPTDLLVSRGDYVATNLVGYWKMGDGTNDEYPVIYDQVDPTLGSEVVTNGDFATDLSSWTGQAGRGSYSWDNGKAKITNDDASSYPNLSQSITTVVGKVYKITATVEIGTATLIEVRAYSNSNIGSQQLTTDGTIEFYITADDTDFTLHLYLFETGNTGHYCYYDNVSVKEVQGNPATMTNMVEGNITNQYPLTKIRNYYRMGDGILDVYPLIADQTNPSLGSEILSQPVDLQTDFVANSGGVIVDADTFTTAGGTFDGIKKSGFLTIGKTYKLTIDGNTTSSGFTIGYLVSGNEYGSGFGTHYFTATTSDLWIRQSTSGTTNITSFTIKQVNGNPGIMTNMSASDIILDTPNEPN